MKKIIIVAAWLIFAGCTKQATIPDEDISISAQTKIAYPQTEFVYGVVDYWGDPEIDGLGWVITTGKTSFIKPIELPETFQIKGLKVAVEYIQTEQHYPCRCIEKILMVEIVNINPVE